MKTLPTTGAINCNVLSAFCMLAVATMALCAYADSFTYVDHWPSGTGDETATDVVVPDNTPATIATAEDVARVERLTSISLGTGATVMYNSSTPMTLSAALSGTGSFFGRDSAMLTIAADNSGLTAPGHFAFTNAQVLVSHEDGLGAAASGAADFFFDSNSLLDFVANAAGVYTNNVKMKVDCPNSSTKLRIGVSPRTARLVQNNDFTHMTGTTGAGTRDIRIDGTIEFISGTVATFPSNGGTGTRWYMFIKSYGGVSHLWFSGNTKFAQRYAFFAGYADSNLIIHLNGASNFGSGLCSKCMICEDENVMGSAYLMPNTDSYLDLNGFNQSMKYFNNAYCGGAPKETTSSAAFRIQSDRPAMLTLTDNSTLTNAMKFVGAAGFCHNNTGTQAIAGDVSTSTNLLDVAKGRVALIWNAGWSGDARVASGAVLELTSNRAFTSGTSRLVVETGGSLVLRDTAYCDVGSANIAGTELTKGVIYTVAQLRDEMHLPVSGDDAAMLIVRGGSGSWSGWPDGGGDVTVDADLTVYVSDDDVAKVSALSSLVIMNGSRVICTNSTVPLVLNANVSGYGTFECVDSAGLVLNGDNSSLKSPGTFYFTNTSVIVSNRYGLGSVDTAMIKFYYGDQNGDALLFRDKGLVVDAPITVSATNASQRVIGPESVEDTLIISNSFRFLWRKNGTADYDPTVYFRNKVRLAGGVFGTDGATAGGHLYTGKKGNYAEVWFDSGVRPSFYYWFASDIVYHLGWDDIHQCYLACTYLRGGRMVCEKDNLFTKFTTGYASGQDNAAQPSYLDLNGHDQEISHFMKNYNSASVGMIVTSSVPATVTIKNYNGSLSGDLNTVKGNFQGAAAFTYSWKGTNEFTKMFSRTTGALTIDKGSFRLRDGAGWGGTNVFVKAGAKLMIAADSMHCAFGNRALLGHQSWTKLDIEAGGTLELAASAEPAVVRTLVYGGTTMPAGTYTKTSGVGIAGDGALRVRSSTDGEPGAVIIVY